MSKVPYDLNKIRAVAFDVDGVLSPSTVPMSDDGEPMRMANIKDGYALQLAVKAGIKIAIFTGARSTNIVSRYKTLGIEDVYIACSHKLPELQKWMVENDLTTDEVAFVGDDIPDLPAMRAVGLPVAPNDAAHEVRQMAVYVTVASGGYGVARELLEQILIAKDFWIDNPKAFGW